MTPFCPASGDLPTGERGEFVECRHEAAAPGDRALDAGRALDLLCEAVRRHGGNTVGAAHGGIVAAALSSTGLAGSDLAIFSRHEVRTLWVRGWLPRPMTLGATVVLGRAQRAQRAGTTWGVAVEHAARSAQLLVGLVPLVPCARSTKDARRPSPSACPDAEVVPMSGDAATSVPAGRTKRCSRLTEAAGPVAT